MLQLNFRPLAGKRLLAVLGCILFLLLGPSVALSQESSKNVLVFYSDGLNGPGAVLVNRVLSSTLKEGSTSPIQIYYESLDSFRVPTEEYDAEMVKLLQRKYEGVNLDLIFSMSNPALKFLVQHRSELFAKVPIVFLVNDERRVADLDLRSNITGVWGKVELAPTLDIALASLPETQRVVVATGNAGIDRDLMTIAQKEFRAYEGRVSFTYLTDVTVEEARQRLAVLPDKTVVIFLNFNVDRTGRRYFSPDVVSQLASTSHAPIYAASETYLDHGIVGGRLLSYGALGVAAGKLGLRILAGESAQSIPPQTIPSVNIFDWRQLRRWNIDEATLPPGSIVRYKEFSVWELYKWRIIGALALIVLQALGIVWLLFTQAKRRQAEKRSTRFALLAESEHQHLDEIVANVPGIVWESKLEGDDPIPRTTFISPYLGRMLGYTAGEWLSKPGFWLSVIVEEDREHVKNTLRRVLETGEDGIAQLRYLTKDGRVLWAEAHLTAICDENGKPVGLRGVTMNITDRRQAEAALQDREQALSEAQRVSKIGSWEWDPLTDTVTWSEEMFRIMGRDSTEPAPSYKEHPALYTPESWQRLNAAVERILEDGNPYEIELEMIHADGHLVWTNARGEVLCDANGKIVKLRGTLQDIAERKRAEASLQKAVEEVSKLKNQLEEENIYLQEEIKLAHNFDQIVGRSDATKYVLFKIEQVAPTDTTVLITGETGTGKELVAHAIHSAGSRRDRPLVKVNCAALSPTLIESELFGHEKGAFTGATARKLGRFELANGATILLDEIGELPLELQAKLLRVIQENEFERLGSSKTIKVDARIIAATNRNLKNAVERGSFREDLWYRLNVFPITVPPLRDRKEDIPGLVEHFVKRFAQKLGRKISSISPASMRILQDYNWPGNVRELANVIERAVINTTGSVFRVGDNFEKAHVAEPSQTNKTLEEMEKEYIIRILDHTGWRIEGHKGAARILGLNPSTLRTRMSKLGIQKLDSGSLLSSAAK